MASEDTTPEGDHGKSEVSKALTPTVESGIGPFIAAAETAAPKARGLGSRLLDYSAHVAIIVGLVGFAWTVGAHVVNQSPAPADVADTPVPKKIDEVAQLKQANAQLQSDVRSLRDNIETLRSSVKQDKTTGQVRALEADLKSVKSGLTSTKTETQAALAQLTGKVDKLERDPPKTASTDRKSVDPTPTGSINASSDKAIPTPPEKPQKFASLDDVRKATLDDSAKPQVISGWVVRDVYEGVALIEGKRGSMEVVPGVSIPGAGVVKSIDRHGSGWTLTTSKGQVAYAAPPHDYRRINAREYYPPYPYAY